MRRRLGISLSSSAVITCAFGLMILIALPVHGQDATGADAAGLAASAPSDDAVATGAQGQSRITCSSSANQRQHCPADTSSGVALVKSTGDAPCLLGKSWGYDDTGIWVSDGCAGEFLAGATASEKQDKEKEKPEYIPNIGFRLYTGEKGEIYFRLFSYARYLNQRA